MATINGTIENDHLTSTSTADTVNGLQGDDVLVANGNDTLNGGSGNDTYQVFGGGAYVLVDAAGIDTLETDESDIRLHGSIEKLMINLGGDGTLATATGNTLDNTITAFGDGSILMDGSYGMDTLKGGNGADTIDGGADADNVHGGLGDDVLLIDSKDWHIDGDLGIDTLAVLPRYFDMTVMPFGRIEEFEVIDLSYSDSANELTLDKTSLKNISVGSDTVDVILGHGDSLKIKGNYEYQGELDGVDYFQLGKKQLLVHGDNQGTSGNNLMAGSQWADFLEGLGGADTLNGGGGNDTLDGGTGGDVLRGGDGNDLLFWESADVRVDGDGGKDTLLCGDLDLTAVANGKIQDIETIACESSTLTLNKSDILDLSSTTNTLKVLGNLETEVDIVGTFKDAGISGHWHQYKLGTAVLLVDTEITNVH
jgi:Ca2+-binding RTX toxin-like protein